ncbi:DoxX family protein [Streptomyces paludis]|uniref:DoxX family protein n=2 Tax=Streptomyces paludis TaxID=2282738 RepID=A0A345I1A4_9ACTN|nr:DoxX family protein [Streptomyces paludis]
MLKVDCDPAQVIVNHASFRVKLASPQRPGFARSAADTARIPALSGARTARRRAPVVWSGRSEPGDPGASGLLQAVRNAPLVPVGAGAAGGTVGAGSAAGGGVGAGATQVIPQLRPPGLLDDEHTQPTPLVGPQGTGPDGRRPAGSGGAAVPPLLPPMRKAVGAYDDLPGQGAYDDGYDARFDGDLDDVEIGDDAAGRARLQRHGNDTVRHAYYPGRRMNLGVVLLPLRVFLGFISIYAGMGKLCDPVYFDGGERGSMVKWLTSLQPWALAEPLRDFALSHPVGAGLSVAFLQIVVGVLTVFGLWQRVAASFGALLSAALLLTVSWRTVPAYDAPDIIYLAAWSPLIIAGAPVYSVDGRLAGEAWRTLGPRSDIWDLRRRVLRRGAIVASVIIGLTLLVGSVLGGAVRSADMVTVPGPNVDPVNQLPGMPLPLRPGSSGSASGSPVSGGPTGGTRSEPSATRSGSPSAQQSAPGGATASESGGATVGASTGAGSSTTGQTQQQQPPSSQTQGTVQQAPQQPEQQPAPPAGGQGGPTSTGGGGGGGGSTGGGTGDGGGAPDEGGSTTGGSSSGGGGSGGGGNRNPIGGLLG